MSEWIADLKREAEKTKEKSKTKKLSGGWNNLFDSVTDNQEETHPYECTNPLCSERFRTKANLGNHQKFMHAHYRKKKVSEVQPTASKGKKLIIKEKPKPKKRKSANLEEKKEKENPNQSSILAEDHQMKIF